MMDKTATSTSSYSKVALIGSIFLIFTGLNSVFGILSLAIVIIGQVQAFKSKDDRDRLFVKISFVIIVAMIIFSILGEGGIFDYFIAPYI